MRDPSVPGKFTCNICGRECYRPDGGLDREIENCPTCGSTVRLRGLIALLSQEIFGVLMALPEFPALKGIRGLGMSDAPGLATRLAEKFDYTNTFYHQAPFFDVTQPDERDRGRYDFIVSSEVMEHVPPPVETAFATLCRMLKPDGLLLMTTPYTLEGATDEHFSTLHEYTLATLGDRTVLVNRRRDGSIEVFENLAFHGGHGSTLEMRVFTEASLRSMFTEAGFASVQFEGGNYPEFGVEHPGAWSLPMVARKGHFHPPAGELARLAARAQRDLAAVAGDYQRHVAFHNFSHSQLEREMEAQCEWVRKVEANLEERTRWALDLQREKTEAIADFQAAEKARLAMEERLKAARAKLARLEASMWARLGRILHVLD